MEYSSTFIRGINNFFRGDIYDSSPHNNYRAESNLNNTSYRKWLKINKLKPSISAEIPVCINDSSYSLFNHSYNVESIYIPIRVYEGAYENVSGGEAVFKKITTNYVNGLLGGLIKVVTKANEVYYGCEGLIFDENFTPLVLATNNVVLNENSHLDILDHILYIHPSVFIHQETTLNKVLSRKFLSYVLSNNVGVAYRESGFKVKVEIKDMSYLFESPEKPAKVLNLTEDVYKFLNGNIKEFLTQLKYE